MFIKSVVPWKKRYFFRKILGKKIDFLWTRRYTVITWSKRELLWSKMEWR